MKNQDSIIETLYKIPEPALRRLPWYLAYVKLLQQEGEEYVSSTQIAKKINVDASQIAKDLSFVSITGKTRVGYEVNSLVKVLESFLGFNKRHKAVLFGVGSLGAALLQDSGLSQYGLEVISGYDIRPEIIGKEINNIPVYHIDQFKTQQTIQPISIGIVTVPVNKAQEIADYMIEQGIKAIWNFTPFRINVPKDIVIQNTSLYAHLAVMFNRLNTL